MSELIERQAAIDAIHCDITVIGKENAETVARTIGEFVDRIKALPTAQPEQQWIPCSERLPDQNGKYLVVGRQKAINILKFDGGRWYGKWGVVAWMPLPDCYKGDENNKMPLPEPYKGEEE